MHTTLIAVDFLFGISVIYNTCIYIPQIIRLIKFKRSEELSLSMFLLFCIAQFITTLYGYFIANDYGYTLGMSLVLTSCGITTYLVIYYRIKDSLKSKITKLQNKSKNYARKYKLYFIISCCCILIILFAAHAFLKPKELLLAAFYLAYAITGFSFILQIWKLLKIKHAKEFSVITFAGFNIIQIITALYAYLHNMHALLLCMLFYLLTNGSLTTLILFYKWKNREF